MCAVPGCDKAVKIAGRCSAHGPARRRCDFDGCSRVAVQGGKCLSHGARRKVCKFEEGCNKNAIIEGMCKKHHDLSRQRKKQNTLTSNQVAGPLCGSMHKDGESTSVFCQIIKSSSASPLPLSSSSTISDIFASDKHRILATPACHSPRYHHRGLSIFDEMPMVDALIKSRTENESTASLKLAADSVVLECSVLSQPPAVKNNASFTAGFLECTPRVPNLQTNSAITNEATITRKDSLSSMTILQAEVETLRSDGKRCTPHHSAASAAINDLGTAMEALDTAIEDYYSPTLEILEHMQNTEGDKFICENPGPKSSQQNRSVFKGLARSVTFCSNIDLKDTPHSLHETQQQPRPPNEMKMQRPDASNGTNNDANPFVEGNYDHGVSFTGSGFIRAEVSDATFQTGASKQCQLHPSTYDQPILLEDNLDCASTCAPAHLGTIISIGSLDDADGKGQPCRDRLLPRKMGAEQNFFGNMYSP